MEKVENKLKKQNILKVFLISFVLLFTIFSSGCSVYFNFYIPPVRIGTDKLSIHFMELGNDYTGDSIYINCGDTDIIVDGGSRTNSVETIKNYVNNYVKDGIIEYAIVTHADRDHIACFGGDGSNPSLFSLYEFKNIIDFPKTNKNTTTYQNYIKERDKEIQNGAVYHNALECYKELNGAKKSIEIGTNVKLNILYNYFYENEDNDENNYSVCFEIVQNSFKFLFTGDLEKDGEKYLIENNSLSKVNFYKAGHHGSKTSSNDYLLDIIKPDICVVPCVAGSYEYTQYKENTFPTQDFINRISKWTNKVYVPTKAVNTFDVDKNKYKTVGHESMNGNIVIESLNEITVNCSNNQTLLKDTTWIKENREIPLSWQ